MAELTLQQKQALAIAEAHARASAGGEGSAMAFKPPQEQMAPAFSRAIAERAAQDELDNVRKLRTTDEADKHAASLTGRIVTEGAVGGVAGLPALATDAGINAGYEGKKLLAKTGLVDPPEKANWFPDGTRMPMSTKVAEGGSALADKMGLDQPETYGERMTHAVGSAGIGAATGTGLGKFLTLIPGMKATGKFLSAAPVSSAAGGMAGGAAAQQMTESGWKDAALPASLLASIGTTMVSKTPGRVRLADKGGIEAGVGELFRRRADNASLAIENARKAKAKTPGYSIIGTEATRDPGIAAIAGPLRSWSNEFPEAGATIGSVERDNVAALRQALIDKGAGKNVGATTNRLTNEAGAKAVIDLDLGGKRSIDVTQKLADLKRNSIATNVESAAEADANGAAYERLLRVSKPVMDAQGNEIGRRIKPSLLHSERAAINKVANDKSAASRGGGDAALFNGGKTTKSIAEGLADDLDKATNGDYRTKFLEPYAKGKSLAENQSYMEDFKQNVIPEGDSKQLIKEPTWLENVNSKSDRKIAGGKKNVTFERLTPDRQAVLQAGADDIAQNRFSTDIKDTNAGRRALHEDTRQIIEEGRGPVHKAIMSALPKLSLFSNAANRLSANPLTGFGLRAVTEAGASVNTASNMTLLQKLQAAAGQAARTPEGIAKALETPRAYNPGPRKSLGLAAMRGAYRGAPEGFLAAERTKRYR